MGARSLAAAALCLASGASARAQVSDDIVEAMAGSYLVVPDDGERGCRIRLGRERTIGGYAAEPDPACETTQPKLANVFAWNMGEGLVNFVDPERHTIMSFAENEGATYRTPGDNVPNYQLVTAAPGVDRAPFVPAILGTWAMQRPGARTICRVTFLDGPPEGGGEESFGLRIGEPCDAAVQRLGLSSWRVEDFQLVLYGTDGDGLSFDPAAGGTFAKSADEGGKPLALVKG